MKTNVVSNLLKVALTTVGLISVAGQGANAGILTKGATINTFLECINDGVALVVGSNEASNTGWQYAFDATNDGSGGSPYEIFGMAIKETSDSIFVALNANTPLTGNYESGAADHNVGWGDMFFNFSGKNFTDAMNGGDLFGVRFAGTNDSGVSQVGVYSGVTAKSVTGENVGYSSLSAYNSAHPGSNLGDLATTSSYFDQSKSLNVISSGTFLTGLNFLNMADLVAAGYNQSAFGGSQTIAFKIDKSDLPGAESVPEPSAMLGLTAIGMALAGSKLRKQRAIAQKA